MERLPPGNRPPTQGSSLPPALGCALDSSGPAPSGRVAMGSGLGADADSEAVAEEQVPLPTLSSSMELWATEGAALDSQLFLQEGAFDVNSKQCATPLAKEDPSVRKCG